MKAKLTVFAVALAGAAICQTLTAHESAEKSSAPGFRPKSGQAAEFVRAAPTATVRVFPTIIRSPEATAYSEDSQRRIVGFLNDAGIVRAAEAAKDPVNPGEAKGRAQFGMFQNDLKTIGEAIRANPSDADYNLVVEVLFPPRRDGRLSVFGIHCYVIDPQGRNAFSFLLNSHHSVFAEAKLVSGGNSPGARDELVLRATEVGLAALRRQLHAASAG